MPSEKDKFVIGAESSTGETRYLLSDGLGSVRQAVDENAAVVAYYEFDPYGNPIDNTSGGDPYVMVTPESGTRVTFTSCICGRDGIRLRRALS